MDLILKMFVRSSFSASRRATKKSEKIESMRDKEREREREREKNSSHDVHVLGNRAQRKRAFVRSNHQIK
jgi:hypothetical protein